MCYAYGVEGIVRRICYYDRMLYDRPMTETDRSVRRLRRPRLTDRWPLRDQSTPLVPTNLKVIYYLYEHLVKYLDVTIDISMSEHHQIWWSIT